MDELEPVPDKLRALFDEEKAGGEPPRDLRERVLLRLAGTFAVGAGGGMSPTAGTDGSHAPASPAVTQISRLATAGRLVRAAVVFTTGAAAGAGGYHVAERSHRAVPAPAPIAAPARRQEAPAPPDVPTPLPAPEPVPAASSAPTRPRTLGPVQTNREAQNRTDDALAAERSLVEMARAALTRGEPERAVATLRRHARQFPNGELTEEREGLLVQALVGAQKYDQARDRAEQFKKRYPRSLFAPVVDQAIGSIP
jgi:TolA-binding protein